MSDTIPGYLTEAAALRIPTDADSGRELVGQLEAYLLRATCMAGDLASQRLQIQGSLRTLEREWAHMQGWERYKRSKTEAAVEDAKREANPKLYDGIQDARWLIRRIDDQYERLTKEVDRCSRLLTPARIDALIPLDFRS